MKKFFLILFILLLISAIVAGIQLFRDGYGKTILTLRDGTMIEVDDTSESGDTFFYEIDGAQYLIDKKDVKSVGKADQKYYVTRIKTKSSEVINNTTDYISDFSDITARAIKHTFPIAFVIIGATMLVIFVLMLVRATVKTDKEPTVPEETPAAEEDEDDEIGQRDIVEYFLKILEKIRVKA